MVWGGDIMAKTTDYTSIMGNLFLLFKEPCGYKFQKDFLQLFFGFSNQDVESFESHVRANFFLYDCYDVGSNIININPSANNRTIDRQTIEDDNNQSNPFRERLESIIVDAKIDTNQLNKRLHYILSNSSQHYLPGKNNRLQEKDNREKYLEEYSHADKEKLLLYYSLKEGNFDISYNLYLLIYFALYKTLPEDFFYGAFYQRDLKEYNQKVTCLYGATSIPSIRAIITLAERENPNLIALYEYAEMFYYGNNNGISVDIKRAYDIYEQASGINKLNNMPDPIKSACHPLALWCLGYILTNYHRENTDLENCATIPKIDILDEETRVERAIIYAQCSYRFINNAPAANLLGKICLIIKASNHKLDYLTEKYKLLKYEDYFKEAADQGYVFSINLLAMIENEYFFSDIDNRDKHLQQFIDRLKQSANQYEPWACNTLAELLRTGKLERRENINGKKTGEDDVVPNIIDPDEAFEYYKKATDLFIDVNSGWSYANMLIFYPNEFMSSPETISNYINSIYRIGNKGAIRLLEKNFEKIYHSPIKEYLNE